MTVRAAGSPRRSTGSRPPARHRFTFSALARPCRSRSEAAMAVTPTRPPGAAPGGRRSPRTDAWRPAPLKEEANHRQGRRGAGQRPLRAHHIRGPARATTSEVLRAQPGRLPAPRLEATPPGRAAGRRRVVLSDPGDPWAWARGHRGGCGGCHCRSPTAWFPAAIQQGRWRRGPR